MSFIQGSADAITLARIPLSLALFFFTPLSIEFLAIYSTVGLTDVLDGYVARITNTESETGARLDSIADVVFFAVCAITVLPVLGIPLWMWVWIASIAVAKTAYFCYSIKKKVGFGILHSKLNKATGVMLFLVPFMTIALGVEIAGTIVCIAATIAVIQEYARINACPSLD